MAIECDLQIKKNSFYKAISILGKQWFVSLLSHTLCNKWALNDKCFLLLQVTWKSHSSVWRSDVMGCHLLRGRMSRANCSLFAVSPYFQPSRSNYLLSVLYSLPPQTSGSRNLNCKLIDAWRLKTTQSCPTTRQNNMKRSRSLTREEVGVKGVGREALYKVLLFVMTFILISELQLQTPQKVCFIHF